MIKIGEKTLRAINNMICEQTTKYIGDIEDAYNRNDMQFSFSVNVKLGIPTTLGVPLDVKINVTPVKIADTVSTVVDENQMDMFPQKKGDE